MLWAFSSADGLVHRVVHDLDLASGDAALAVEVVDHDAVHAVAVRVWEVNPEGGVGLGGVLGADASYEDRGVADPLTDASFFATGFGSQPRPRTSGRYATTGLRPAAGRPAAARRGAIRTPSRGIPRGGRYANVPPVPPAEESAGRGNASS